MATKFSSIDVKCNCANTNTVDVGDGARFDTIKEAVDYVALQTPTPSDTWTVMVHKGTYQEQNPINIPDNVYVKGSGRDEVVVEGLNADVIFTDAGTGRKELSGLTIKDGTIGLQATSSSLAVIEDVKFQDQTTGSIDLSGATSDIRVKDVEVEAANGASYIFKTSSTSLLELKDVKVRVDAGRTVTDGLRAESGSQIKVEGLDMFVDPGGTLSRGVYSLAGEVKIAGSNNIIDGADEAVRLTDSANSKVSGNGLTIENAGTYSVNFENGGATSAVFAVNGSWDIDKLNARPNGYRAINNRISTASDEDNTFEVAQPFAVGARDNGRNAWIGRGAPGYTGMTVLRTADDISFTDVTSDATDPITTFAAFPGTGAGNILYIGLDQRFPGIDIAVGANELQLGAGAVEYECWNGGGWVSMNRMVNRFDTPHTHTGDRAMLSPSQRETITFDRKQADAATSSWATTTVDGVSAYWLRIRVSSPITQVPLLRRIGLHTSATRFSQDGTRSNMGRARTLRRVNVPLDIVPDADAPTLANRAISATVSNRGYVQHPDAATTKITGKFILPDDIDISSGLDMRLLWSPSTGAAGNVRFRFTTVLVRNTALPGLPLVNADSRGSLAEVTQSITAATPGVADRTVSTQLDTRIISSYTPGDEVYIMVERLGNDAADTYAAAIFREGFQIAYRIGFDGE